MKTALAVVIALMLAVFGGWNATRLAPAATWAEGERRGSWKLVFDSHGSARENDGEVYLRPTPPEGPGSTRAGLAVSADEYPPETDFTVTVETLDQLREGEPNPWEVAWVRWGYGGSARFYYFILKPNGIELGKAHPGYPGAQRFLYTASSPRLSLGGWNRIRVRQVGSTVDVWVDGVRVVEGFVDTPGPAGDGPYLRGRVGLYTEDASTLFDDVRARSAVVE